MSLVLFGPSFSTQSAGSGRSLRRNDIERSLQEQTLTCQKSYLGCPPLQRRRRTEILILPQYDRIDGLIFAYWLTRGPNS